MESRRFNPLAVEADLVPLDYRRVKTLFGNALDRDDPAERAAFLDLECGADAELRARIEQLLAALGNPAPSLAGLIAAGPDETSGLDFLLGAPVVVPSGVTIGFSEQNARPDARDLGDLVSPVGTTIGDRYKIRQAIGEGGMGTVYLAEQFQPVKRMVALKLIRAGMDSRTVLARFDSERQALAIMDHPNIARVLDAGTTERGHPYFVMDLVRGVPLTDYCDNHRLGLPERLALFRQICGAVQHAHQKGIIHRDLKPTNILVEAHDGRPVPKVIDFGLAKATSGLQLTEQSLFTVFGALTGTPLYMAPEQATFNALDIDTRADIYALGVILYELLTGSTPIHKETLHSAALDEMLRVIREDEPPTPSSRISSSDALHLVAANRLVEPARLGRFLRGDLDWIVMKALAKERSRRYDSAIGLANDVECFLNDEPVTAGPPTARYRTGKFIRRHRGQVIAASLVLLALVGGVVGTTLGLIEAKKQEREAGRQTRIARAEAAAKELARQAEATQRLHAERQEGIARNEAAEKEKAREAEADQRQRAERRLAQIAKTNEILGSIFQDINPNNVAEEGKPLSALLGERLDQATAQIEGEAIGDPLTVARMQLTLAKSLHSLGYPEKAIHVFTKCRATFAAQLGPDDPNTLTAMNGLASAYLFAGQPDRAMPLLEQTLALRRANLGPDHPDTLTSMGFLALAYRDIGQLDRALPLFEQTLALRRAKLGPDHPDTLANMGNLAITYRFAGQLDRALPLLEQTLALRRAKLGPDHPYAIASIGNLASAYQDIGQVDRALPLFEQTLALRRAKLGPDHPYTIASMGVLASAYKDAGKLDRAQPLLRELAIASKRQNGPESALYAQNLATLGANLVGQQKWSDAEPLLRDCLAIYVRTEADTWSTFHARSVLGEALLGQKRYEEAAPLLREGYEGMKQRFDQIPLAARTRPGEALDRLIRLAEATGKPGEANAWREEKARLPAPPAPVPAAAPQPGAGKP